MNLSLIIWTDKNNVLSITIISLFYWVEAEKERTNSSHVLSTCGQLSPTKDGILKRQERQRQTEEKRKLKVRQREMKSSKRGELQAKQKMWKKMKVRVRR